MKCSKRKRMLVYLLAALMTLTGCSAAPTGQPTEPQEMPAETVSAEPRQMVEWSADAVIYEVNIRQYTEEGTFAAFSEHLQTLKDMGINTLWLMPIHPISETNRVGTLGSYYSVSDYREVNPEFGTKDNFRDFVKKAHEMGFKVMLDWVANHTGWDCAWIREHPDWYTKDANGNITDPPGMGWKDVADLNYDNMEMRREMIACMKYWVEEFDIDGFHCDHANGVPVDFWEDARRELETVKPLLMLAEDNAVISLLEYAFDFNYNWALYDALVAVAQDRKSPSVVKYYIPENYPEGTYTLNFLDNHDKNSYEYTITGAFGADALPAMFTLLYTIPGTPLIYTGDEIGLDHNIAFMEKDPVNWENTDVSYRELLAELAAIRADNPALHSGNFGGAIAYYDISRSVFAFSRDNEDYKSFAKMEWVYPYAVFIALKKQNDLRCWNEWPKEQQDWILDRMYDISHLEDEIGYQLFTQFLFYTQWMKLKAYANEKQIQIMGDVPFYVGIDSLDVWSSREDFLLDENWRPSFVAGVPPDYFSVTGQRWGNPIYNWENLERKGFTFWVNRLEYSSKLYDIVRIDHFRAFDTYWKIPASCDTAVEGEWLEAPGYAFFNTLFRQLPDIRIVAEDLGDLRPEVLTLRDRFNLMGMNVAVFSLPYSDSVEEHQLIYTGTHDNQTVKDWYHVMDKKTKKKVRDKLAKFGHPRECINHLMLRYVYESAASMAIVPLADILGLDHHARLNTPGTVGSPNWEWRLENWRSLHRKKALVRAIVLESGRALVK